MKSSGLEVTLSKAVAATRSAKLRWEEGAQQTRYITNFGDWRLRIECVDRNEAPPFKFSLTQPGSGKGEIDALTTLDEDQPTTEGDVTVNESLQQLWEMAAGKSSGSGEIDAVNRALDALEP